MFNRTTLQLTRKLEHQTTISPIAVQMTQFRQFSGFGMGMPSPPELRDIAKLEYLEKENPRRISEIWMDQYRFHTRYMSRVLNKDDYETFINRLEEGKQFIWPIQTAKDDKYFVLFSQYVMPSIPFALHFCIFEDRKHAFFAFFGSI